MIVSPASEMAVPGNACARSASHGVGFGSTAWQGTGLLQLAAGHEGTRSGLGSGRRGTSWQVTTSPLSGRLLRGQTALDLLEKFLLAIDHQRGVEPVKRQRGQKLVGFIAEVDYIFLGGEQGGGAFRLELRGQVA